MKKISIIIVDDHRLVRETWSFILNSDPRFKVIGECSSGEEAVEEVLQVQPDVVVMDINLPGINGIEATEEIVRSGCRTKVLGVSLHTQPKYAHRMLQVGAMGYITKNSAKDEMFLAICEVMEGRRYLCEEIRGTVALLLEAERAGSGVQNVSGAA